MRPVLSPGTPETTPMRWWRAIDGRYLLYVYLHLAGFAVTTLLIVWGLFFLFFLAIGGLSIDGMMHQLDNLAGRYVAADPERVAAFKRVLLAAHLLLAGAVIVFRRHAILPSRDLKRSMPHG